MDDGLEGAVGAAGGELAGETPLVEPELLPGSVAAEAGVGAAQSALSLPIAVSPSDVAAG